MQIRRGPRHCKRGGPKQQDATGIHLLGRPLRSDETQARRPIKFTSMRVDLGREVDDDSRNPSKSVSGPVVQARASNDDARDVSPFAPRHRRKSFPLAASSGQPEEGKQSVAVSPIRKNRISAGAMLGKRGENPPLPRNCKRRIRDCICHCPQKVGRRNRTSTTS